jgi:trimeric autotransporter adhesin
MTWVVSDIQVRSNVLDVGTRTRTPCLFRADDYTNTRTAEQMQITADYDLFARPSTAALGSEVAWSNRPNGTKYFSSVAAFRSATGQEMHGSGQDASTISVLNGDTADGNLSLRPGNPAKGKGAPLPADVAAAIGQPAGGSPDPGAFFG